MKDKVIEINGIKAYEVNVIVQDINSVYPKVYVVKNYPQMTKEILKALEDMSIFYNGILHFGGYYVEDGIFYIYYVDHHNVNNGIHSFTAEEITEAYYNALLPTCINIDMKFVKPLD